MEEDSGVSLEVAILLVLGIFEAVLAIRMFTVDAWPAESAFGLFIVIDSLQVITMGKTPFGDFKRSWPLGILGLLTALFGM